jgi:polyphenol oxidase
MIFHQSYGDLLYLTFRNLEAIPTVRHAFSTRKGGVSESVYASMNLGFHRGDDESRVMENFRRFTQATGMDINGLVFGAQTHSANVRRVFSNDRGSGFSKPTPWADTDGLVTKDPGVTLTTFYADCVPLFFADPVTQSIGLSHAGWRGTVANIAGATVKCMMKEFGSNPGDILVGIGPSIGRCCFEIGEEVAGVFLTDGPEWMTGWVIRDDSTADNGPVKYHADLPGINRRLLEGCGILPENIESSNLCTFCNSDWLFSHRASHGLRGSLCAMIQIAP